METKFDERDTCKHGLKGVYQLHINDGTSVSLILKKQCKKLKLISSKFTNR